MNLPKSELSRQEALQLWNTCHSDYAKEQMILSNHGIVFFGDEEFKHSSDGRRYVSDGNYRIVKGNQYV